MNDYVRIRRGPGLAIKVLLALVLVIVLGVGGFIAYKKLSGGSDSSSPIVAGESFEPGESQTIYDTKTTAKLDGTKQLVTAKKPSDEWKEHFPKAKCDDGVCTAAAPKSVPGSDDGGGFHIPGLPTGLGLGGLAGAGLLALIFYYVFIDEDEH